MSTNIKDLDKSIQEGKLNSLYVLYGEEKQKRLDNSAGCHRSRGTFVGRSAYVRLG